MDGVTYTVTAITDSAFNGNKTITKVTIPNNVTTIGANAFNGCTKLKTVTVGSSVTTIGAKAFKGCKALTKVSTNVFFKKNGKASLVVFGMENFVG